MCVNIWFFFSSRRRHTRSSTVSWLGDVYKRQEHTLERTTKIVSGMDVKTTDMLCRVYGLVTTVYLSLIHI